MIEDIAKISQTTNTARHICDMCRMGRRGQPLWLINDKFYCSECAATTLVNNSSIEIAAVGFVGVNRLKIMAQLGLEPPANILKWEKKNNKLWEAETPEFTYLICLEGRIYWPRQTTRFSTVKLNGKLSLKEAKETCENHYRAQIAQSKNDTGC